MPKAKLVADLVSMKKNIRSILFGAKLKNVRVVDPATICATDDPENWEDTVHLRWEQYVKLAAGLSAMMAGVKSDGETGDGANDTPRTPSESGFCPAVFRMEWAASPQAVVEDGAAGVGEGAARGHMVGGDGGRVSRKRYFFFLL